MLLAALQQVSKFYGEQTVLEQTNLEIRAASRIALIGRNGAGKSTILRLLMEREEPDDGLVYRREDVMMAMLEQDPNFPAGARVRDIAERAFAPLDAMESQLQALERAGLDDMHTFERWEYWHERFELRGGYERRSRRDAVLYALGFRGREDDEAANLSGGEKTRLGLAQLLMAQPDVLLLDEPTNHLDMAMREWLEGYLSRYPGGVVIVSHDRMFLDSACSSTAEIALATLRSFDDVPSRYRTHRSEQMRIEAATRANEQREHERLQAMSLQMKNWAGQNSKLARRAKAMEKRTERYAQSMLPEAEKTQRRTRFQFLCEPSADTVMQAAHLSKRFGDTPLFEGLELQLFQGQRVALVGPNGAGKSSLLKMLLGELASDDPRGYVRYGARVRVGYYDQELRGVDPELTLMEEMIRLVGDAEAHNLLGRFLFPYEAQYKRIADLSGGERARLALLKLTMGEYNLLVLDEPTNHLDVEMIEALEDALADYEGSLLIVSHDRRFIAGCSNLIWELQDGALLSYEGDWDFYLRKRPTRRQSSQPSEAPTASTSSEAVSKPDHTPSKWQLERSLESLETEISTLESELEQLSAQLATPDALSAEAIAELGEAHSRIEQHLLERMATWDEAQDMLQRKVSPA